MGLDVVAEGVEDEAELAALRDMGCASVQGYLLGWPCSPEDVAVCLSGTRLEECCRAL